MNIQPSSPLSIVLLLVLCFASSYKISPFQSVFNKINLQNKQVSKSSIIQSTHILLHSNNHHKSTIWVAGEVLIDLIPNDPGINKNRQAIVGGSGANVAKAAAQLGLNSVFLASLSTDKYGLIATKHLEASNVNLKYANVCDKSTCLAIVSLDKSGSASYEFLIDGTATFDFSPAWLPSPRLTPTTQISSSSVSISDSTRNDNVLLTQNSNSPNPSLLLVGSLVTVIEPAASELYTWISSLPSHLPIIFDPNIRPAVIPDKQFYRLAVENWIKVSSVVKASDEDLHAIYPHEDDQSIVEKWFQLSSRLELIVFTRGADGIVAYTRSGIRSTVPAVGVDVVDTIGAGDTVSAILCDALVQFGLHNICHNNNGSSSVSADDLLLTRVLRRAARAAAICCSRAGAVPPSAEELSGYPY